METPDTRLFRGEQTEENEVSKIFNEADEAETQQESKITDPSVYMENLINKGIINKFNTENIGGQTITKIQDNSPKVPPPTELAKQIIADMNKQDNMKPPKTPIMDSVRKFFGGK